MKVTIEITTDNAAFEGAWWGFEVARILDKLEDTMLGLVGNPGDGYKIGLLDSNGNRVGFFKVEGD